jgi:hypothetical protein
MLEDASMFPAIAEDAKTAGLQRTLEIFEPFLNDLDRRNISKWKLWVFDRSVRDFNVFPLVVCCCQLNCFWLSERRAFRL